jgi:methionyl aminopeptidase
MTGGLVIAIEPMINLGTGDVKVMNDGWTVVTGDNKPSAHWEHTIVVYGDRTEVLTGSLEALQG